MNGYYINKPSKNKKKSINFILRKLKISMKVKNRKTFKSEERKKIIIFY